MQEFKSAKGYILQQQDDANQFLDEHFEAGYWRQRPGFEVISAGRGGSYRIRLNGKEAILRRYLRGGAVSKLLSDQYLWMGKVLSRPWREWKILERARRAGLPVPEPIAACIYRSGLWYRAALITLYLQDTEMLTQRLEREALKPGSWHRIGLLVKQMHAAGIRHADLTSDNLLIDSRDRFYLIDFDKAHVMNVIGDWQWRPLYRFQRSLEKRHRKRKLHYDDDDWQALMDGYQS